MEICSQCGIDIKNSDKFINKLLVCENCFVKLENKSIGLGDTIQKFTQATGLDIVAKKVANSLGFEDCGCNERKKLANERFPYIWPKYKK